MKLLAIETATEACSAALRLDGAVTARYAVAPREHGRLLLEMIEALLAEAGIGVTALDGVAFGRGPGAFTGVRMAASVTQGVAFAADLPVVPVSSLAALAQAACTETAIPRALAAIDARMGEVYWGVYRADAQGLVMLEGSERVAAPDRVPVPSAERWVGIGTGWETYAGPLTERLGGRLAARLGERYPHAGDVAALGEAALGRGEVVTAAQALPVYLRNDVADTPRAR